MFRGVRPALLASAAVSGPFPGPRAKMHRDGEKLQASDSIIPPSLFLSSKFFVPEEKSRPPGASAPPVRPCSRASCGAGRPGRRAARRGRTWRRVPAPHPYKYAVPGATASLPGRPDGRRRMETLDNEGFCAYIVCREIPPRQEAREKESPAASRAWTRYPRMIPVYARIPPLVQVLFRVCFFFQHVRQHPAADLLRLHAAGL